jgi:spore germination protein YaaH
VAQRGWRNQAKRYGAPLAFLVAATIAVLLVRSGLQSDAASDTSSPTTVVTRTSPASVPPRQRRFYRLRAGETLSDVAIRFDTTVEQLRVLNPGIQETNLRVGQRVRVK